MRQKIILLSSLILLAGCSTDQTAETETEEVQTEGTEVVEEPNEPSSSSHQLANFINDTTFLDIYALQAWDDYEAVIGDVTYGDMTHLNSEEPDFSQLEGSTQGEIEELFSALDLREDVFMEELAVTDTEKIQLYRYPAKPDSEYSEISDFLAEISYYYIDDNLVFSSITPGLYEFSLNGLPDAETLTGYTHISEIEALDPQVYTIAEMKLDRRIIQQLMIPAMTINDAGNEEVTAFYFFINEEDILYYAYLPFELVSQSFPDNSLALYGQMLPEIAKYEF